MTEPTTTPPEIKLGNIPLRSPVGSHTRLSLMLWGPSGCGKTTLAATAPGEKLWLMLDPDGDASLAHRSDVHVLPLYEHGAAVVEKFKTPNPLDIERVLRDNPNIRTVVFDSTTTFGEKALQHGVEVAAGTKKGKSSTLEDPGLAGYGNKNVWTHLAVSNLLASTAKYKANMIFIAHEGTPDKNDEGIVTQVTLLLGSTLSKEVPIKISEVWAMYDNGQKRFVAVRPCRSRTPMKTRMFVTSGEPEFELKYDPLKDGDDKAISGWLVAWAKNNYQKIPLPK